MTLDEAIKHCEEVAEEKENEAQDLEYSKLDWRHEANKCSKCAEEHRKLARWLRELKAYKEQEPKTGHWIYFKAVNTGEIIWSKCSKCGNEERGCAQRMKYCPECGIKMQEMKK